MKLTIVLFCISFLSMMTEVVKSEATTQILEEDFAFYSNLPKYVSRKRVFGTNNVAVGQNIWSDSHRNNVQIGVDLFLSGASLRNSGNDELLAEVDELFAEGDEIEEPTSVV